MADLALPSNFKPMTTVVTLRLSHKVMTISDEAKHWDQYVALIKWARSLNAAGWQLDFVETIDKEVSDG